MLIVLLAISFKSRSSRVVPLWSKLSINPNELLKEKKECPAAEIRLLWRHIIMRQKRADRDDDFVEVRVHVGSLGPTLVVANLDIARHKDVVQ